MTLHDLICLKVFDRHMMLLTDYPTLKGNMVTDAIADVYFQLSRLKNIDVSFFEDEPRPAAIYVMKLLKRLYADGAVSDADINDCVQLVFRRYELGAKILGTVRLS
ncbi:MAG: hypothetical protein RLZZ469_1652 [Bacteroidota bacterium]|jgi:hypothetical protein